jgi:hypothetical protein
MRERIEHTDHRPDRDEDTPTTDEIWSGRDRGEDTGSTDESFWPRGTRS